MWVHFLQQKIKLGLAKHYPNLWRWKIGREKLIFSFRIFCVMFSFISWSPDSTLHNTTGRSSTKAAINCHVNFGQCYDVRWKLRISRTANGWNNNNAGTTMSAGSPSWILPSPMLCPIHHQGGESATSTTRRRHCTGLHLHPQTGQKRKLEFIAVEVAIDRPLDLTWMRVAFLLLLLIRDMTVVVSYIYSLHYFILESLPTYAEHGIIYRSADIFPFVKHFLFVTRHP